ncbi:MAG: ABC transporter permease, partial [Yaniella sp.]|nr:ABC transporter permease [Yaniella sp.]
MSRTAKILATLFVGLVVTAALFPSLLAPGDPLAVKPSEAFQAPSLQYPFGTDESGRNVYTRVVHGTADSLTIGLAATALGMGIAILLGVITAFGPRWIDSVILRLLEVLYAIPALLMALLIIAFTGPGTTPAIIA